MKIYIGPYVNRWVSRVFDHWMKYRYGVERYWGMTEAEYTRLDRAIERLEDVLQSVYNRTINQLLDRKQRKISIRIDHYDVWSADHTLAMVIAPTLRELKNRKHGSPFVEDEDVPENLRSNRGVKENEWDTDSLFHDRWKWVLDEMIWAFEQAAGDDYNTDQFHSYVDDPTARFGIRQTRNDAEGREAHYLRIKNGMRLFAKYYMGLWD